MEILLILLILLLVFGGGGWYTSRVDYAGPPALGGFLWVLCAVVVIVLVVRLLGVV